MVTLLGQLVRLLLEESEDPDSFSRKELLTRLQEVGKDV